MASVDCQKLWKRYGELPIVKGVDLHINDGEFVAMVGPSGCGKSTILRMLAGLEEISEGEVFLGENNITLASPGKREVSMVFQDYALYPHMSVFENLAFGLRLKKMDEAEIQSRVNEAARMLDLGDYLNRKPKELSGGQRQRVAMGRAVVKRAKLFLFDEPLSNLDAKLRGTMRGEIKRFHQKNKTTTLYVTHDQLEAMTLADRIVVLNQGEIEQEGKPMEVFESPRTLFVARFIGSPEINIFDVQVKREGDVTYVTHGDMGWKFSVPKEKSALFQGRENLKMGIRPSDVYIAGVTDEYPQWSVDGTVDLVELLGKNAYITFSFSGSPSLVTGEVMGGTLPSVEDKVKVTFNLNHAHFFDPKTEVNLLSL